MGFGRIRGIFTGIVLYHRKDGKRVPRGLASALAALQDQAVGRSWQINSELVGFPLELLTVKPKYFCRVSRSPRSRHPRWRGGWHVHPGGGGAEFPGDLGIQDLGHGVDHIHVLHGHDDGLTQVLVSLDVGGHTDLVDDGGDVGLQSLPGGGRAAGFSPPSDQCWAASRRTRSTTEAMRQGFIM